jgi:hypothetical protein
MAVCPFVPEIPTGKAICVPIIMETTNPLPRTLAAIFGFHPIGRDDDDWLTPSIELVQLICGIGGAYIR